MNVVDEYRRIARGIWPFLRDKVTDTVGTVANTVANAVANTVANTVVGDAISAIPLLSAIRVTSGKNGVAFGMDAQLSNTADFGTWNVVGKVLGLGAAKESIAENADLNDYTTPGVYGATTAIATSGTSFPTTAGGTLRVWSALGSIGTTYICQEYVDWHNTSFRRYTADGGTAWSSWRTLATQSWVESLLFDAGTQLAGTETLTSLSIGNYEANSNSIAAALQSVSSGNCPTDKNFSLRVYNRLSTPRKGLIITDSQGDVYIKQQSTASNWTDWVCLTEHEEPVVPADTVVEAGTDATTGWSYRKWASGQCELWQTYSMTATSSTAISTGAAYYSNTVALTLPFAVSNATITGSATRKCFFVDQALASNGQSISYCLMRFTAVPTTQTIAVHIHVSGDLQ